MHPLQIHLPQSPALGVPTGDCGKLTSPLPFLLPRFSSMYEHLLEDEWVVQSSNIPYGVLIQK